MILIRKDGHWKNAEAADADEAKKLIDENFPDRQQPLVVILPVNLPAAKAKKAE
jgi:hypothetical protein